MTTRCVNMSSTASATLQKPHAPDQRAGRGFFMPQESDPATPASARGHGRPSEEIDMTDPTADVDWYPSALRHNAAASYTPWDKYEAVEHVSALPPDPRERNEALRALNQVGSLVYAIRLRDGLIKIGFTTDLAARRWKLGGEILAVRFGTLDDEQALHAELVAHRHHGREWYWPTQAVLEVINDMRGHLGLPPLAA